MYKNKSIFIILVIYLIVTVNLSIYKASIYTNIINPIFWGCMAIYFIQELRKYQIRLNRNKKYFRYMLIISFINVLINFYLGFVFGFSKSPYNHNILVVIKNVFIKIIPIIGIEITRVIMIKTNRNNKKAIILVTIMILLVELDYHAIADLFCDRKAFFEYICGNVVPLIVSSMLYTYLTLKCSYSLTLTFRIINETSILLLPILTDMNWFAKGSLEIISVLVIFLLFQARFIEGSIERKRTPLIVLEKIVYSIIITFCVLLVFFMLGIFKYEPITILSSSMKPAFNRNDVIIYKKLTEEELKNIPKNSIIIYSTKNQNIAHRVVDIVKQDNSVKYQTKGDSNNTPDSDLVETDQIKGIYIFHIKYIGFPSVFLYEYFHYEDAK